MMMDDFQAFHDKLSTMDAASFDTNAIKEMMKDSMSSMSQDIKQQLEESFAQVMEGKSNGSDGDPSQKDKLDYLIEMVKSTKDQISGMEKDVKDLNALSTTLSELPTGSTEKYIMPRTFILVPVGNEPEPISTSTVPVKTATAIPAPEETKKSRFGMPDFGIKKAVATAGTAAASAVGQSIAGMEKGIGQVVEKGIGIALEKGKKALTKACRGAYRLCWKTLRVQFICPVTMQPIPMVGPEGCLITMPTDFLIYSAKALHYGMIILKIAMATQGLGAVVPDLSGIIPVNLGMDIKQFASEYTELHGEATAIMDHLKLDKSSPVDQVVVVAEGAATDKAQAEVARLRNQFTEQFKGIAEGDGTTEVLAIYKLIAEGRKQTLASALQSSWQPKDVHGKAWGMEEAHPSDCQPGQVIWASEEGARRLELPKKQGGGLDALNPKADVNRDTVKTSSTATELVISAAASTADNLAKSAGINLVAIKQRCAEEYGISPDAVMSVVTNPLFSQIVFLVASKKKDNKEKAANISEGLIHKDLQDSSGLTSDKLSALRDLLLSGGNDWSSLEHLAAVALDKSGVMEAKALWTLAKRSTSLKITAIERRTVKECGFRSGDVKAIFVAAVDSPVFKSAIEALISGNSDSAAFRQFKGNEFSALVDGVAEKTGISLPEIEMVLSALITSDLTKLQPLTTGTQASTPVEERGLKVLWALVERFKIVPVDKIERCAKKCGLRPADVESIFVVALSDAVFKDTICKLMNNDHSGVTQQSQGLTFLLHFVATKIGKPLDTINAVINAIVTGNSTKLEEVAKNAGKVVVGDHGPKALWALVKQATSLKISAIERRAEEHGIKPGEVETLFLAAASDYAFIDAMRELMNNQPGLAKDLVQGSALDALVTVVEDKTGVLPAKVKAVLTALLTMDLAALETLASGSVKPSASPRGGRVAGLREEVTSGGASVLHEALKGKEVLLQQKEVAMQTALQQKDEVLKQKDEVLKQKDEVLQQNERLLQQNNEMMRQKDEMVQLLKSQLEEAKKK